MATRFVLRASTFAAPLLVSLISVGFALAACGGSSDASLFNGSTPDAGTPDPSYDSGTLNNGDTGAGGESSPCTPAPIGASFKPTWKGPSADRSGACTTQQMSDFYDACLTPPIDAKTCSDYTKANGGCATCLASEDTAPKYGPVVWHQSHSYFTVNIAGCLADEQGDKSNKSCGAAYQGLLECKETSCSSCFAAPGSSFQNFADCESQASTTCQSYADTMHTACGDSIHDAADPASTCVPPSGTKTRDAYLKIAPVFCGN